MENRGPEIPKKMLILKSIPSSINPTEIFLRNRGWEVFSTSDIKEALVEIVSQKYSYIMISLDHSNQKVPMLPHLISEKYKVAIIAFVESTSAASYKKLVEMKVDYKVYAPVTGPAVERCVNKITKDYHMDLKIQSLQEDLKNFSGTASPPETRIPAFENRSNELIFLRSPKKPIEYQSRVMVLGRKPPRGYGIVHVTKPKKNIWGQLENEVNKDLRDGRLFEMRQRSESNETLIARATYKSLIGSVEILDGRIRQRIEEITNSSCILIESDRFSGYLVAALGKDHHIEDKFIKKIRETLIKFLEENGEHVNENDVLNLKIKPVDFEPWALEYAEFMKTSVHKGSEVAMAFFPRKPLRVDFEESFHPDMAKVKLQDLQGDRRVDFDLYMYLENNQKYILYTPKGGIFYSNQLDRLKNRGVTHMHVQIDSLQAVSKYHAQNYLDDIIDDFEEKHRIESAIGAA